MKKKIIFVTHFFKPETGAASVRADYFVKALKKAGHDVLVIAPKPNYPLGKIFEGYKQRGVIEDKEENIVYLPIYFVGSHSPIGRLFSYLSYFVFSLLYLLKNISRPDIVISSSPPLFTSLSALFYSKIKKCNFVLDVRDIWPDIGIELGILKNGFLISGLGFIEKYLYKNADKIIVTAEGDKKNIEAKIDNLDQCEIIYNGADTDIFIPLNSHQKNEIRQKYNIPIDKTVLVFFGSYNHGMNDIETMGKFLSSDKFECEKFHFLSIGSGDNQESLIEIIPHNLSITSFDSLPMNEVALLVGASDISLIPRKSIVHDTGGNVPVKCFESWAAGIPVLLSNINAAEISNIFQNCQAGILVEPNDHKALDLGLNELLKKDIDQMGADGRTFVFQNYDRKTQSKKLLHIVGDI